MFRKITASDLPKPYATKSASNTLKLSSTGRRLAQSPPGFKVELYATGLSYPRLIRKAPNGDLFLADAANHSQNNSGAIKILRGITKDGNPEKISTFTAGLNTPFGIAFYPVGSEPKYVYVGNTDSVVRFPYKNGDTKAPRKRLSRVAERRTRDPHQCLSMARKTVCCGGSRANVADVDTVAAESAAPIFWNTRRMQVREGLCLNGNLVGIADNPQRVNCGAR
jgi:hypothetical protein